MKSYKFFFILLALTILCAFSLGCSSSSDSPSRVDRQIDLCKESCDQQLECYGYYDEDTIEYCYDSCEDVDEEDKCMINNVPSSFVNAAIDLSECTLDLDCTELAAYYNHYTSEEDDYPCKDELEKEMEEYNKVDWTTLEDECDNDSTDTE